MVDDQDSLYKCKKPLTPRREEAGEKKGRKSDGSSKNCISLSNTNLSLRTSFYLNFTCVFILVHPLESALNVAWITQSSSFTHSLQIHCIGLIGLISHIFWVWVTNRNPTKYIHFISIRLMLFLSLIQFMIVFLYN